MTRPVELGAGAYAATEVASVILGVSVMSWVGGPGNTGLGVVGSRGSLQDEQAADYPVHRTLAACLLIVWVAEVGLIAEHGLGVAQAWEHFADFAEVLLAAEIDATPGVLRI